MDTVREIVTTQIDGRAGEPGVIADHSSRVVTSARPANGIGTVRRPLRSSVHAPLLAAGAVLAIAAAVPAACSSGGGIGSSLPSITRPPSASTTVPRPTTSLRPTTTAQGPTTTGGQEGPITTVTDAPTTAAPTTASPPTTGVAAPTTAAPTTAAPPTAAPTTSAPTTAAPTTSAPTTAAPTTTTVAPAAPKSSSSTPWGWIIAGIAIAAAVIGLIVWLVTRRNRTKALAAWRHDTESSLDSAHLARTLLPAAGQDVPDPAHWQAVHERVEQAAQSLDQSGTRAPTPEGAVAARTAADKLRGLWFALESDRLLREGAQPPTPEQLAQADTVTRARGSELDAALADLDRVVRPPQAGPNA
jgi:hypothetical protein